MWIDFNTSVIKDLNFTSNFSVSGFDQWDHHPGWSGILSEDVVIKTLRIRGSINIPKEGYEYFTRKTFSEEYKIGSGTTQNIWNYIYHIGWQKCFFYINAREVLKKRYGFPEEFPDTDEWKREKESYEKLKSEIDAYIQNIKNIQRKRKSNI